MRKNVTIATPTRVGNIRRNRLSRYFHMSWERGRAGGVPARPRWGLAYSDSQTVSSWLLR